MADWQDEYDQEFVAEITKLCAENIALAGLEQAIIEGTYEALLATFTGATKEEVLAAAQASAAKLVTGISDQMVKQMADKIATALENQIGHVALSKQLKEGLGLDSNRQKTLDKYRKELEDKGVAGEELQKQLAAREAQLIDERAHVIAQTEMGKALQEGALAEAQTNGDTHKVWIAVGDYDDECLGNEAQGPIPVDAAFETGHQCPPAHPRCKCSLGFVKDTGKGEKDRAAKRAEERSAQHAEERAAQ